MERASQLGPTNITFPSLNATNHEEEDGPCVLGLSAHALGLIEMVAAGGMLLLTVAVSLLCVTLLFPLVVFLSPVLVPVSGLLFAGVTFALTSGGVAIAVASAASWGYHYFTGRRPPAALLCLLPHDDRYNDEAPRRSFDVAPGA